MHYHIHTIVVIIISHNHHQLWYWQQFKMFYIYFLLLNPLFCCYTVSPLSEHTANVFTSKYVCGAHHSPSVDASLLFWSSEAHSLRDFLGRHQGYNFFSLLHVNDSLCDFISSVFENQFSWIKIFGSHFLLLWILSK